MHVDLPELATQQSIGEAMAGFAAHEQRLLDQLETVRGIRSKVLSSFLAR
ncbi:hypothetical protein ACFV6Z_32500 [Streptomyces sp. NPDC059818]